MEILTGDVSREYKENQFRTEWNGDTIRLTINEIYYLRKGVSNDN